MAQGPVLANSGCRLPSTCQGSFGLTSSSWIVDAVGEDRVRFAETEAARRRLRGALDLAQSRDSGERSTVADERLRFVAGSMGLRVIDQLVDGSPEGIRAAAADAFRLARALDLPETPVKAAEALVRLGCFGVLGDRGADVRRILRTRDWELPTASDDWGERVWATVLDVWLRLLRQNGWDDFDAVQFGVDNIRSAQRDFEPSYLSDAEARMDASPAWQLIANYHLSKAAELLGEFQTQGSVDGHYDIRQQLEAQFDRAVAAAARGQLVERETLSRLLERTASTLVDNSIWTVTRAVNSRVSSFVKTLTARDRPRPIFEMLPPQRNVLSEQGLLGSARRSVVVQLPTSSGKTFIAEFRILQALNQFDHERGWVAYLAPTRALVNQLARHLERDFKPIGIAVEKVSPALEFDSHESRMLEESEPEKQFRILVTTPEKLDLMLRGDWESRIGRPLTLVVVDEAHGIGTGARGLRLELLLATINRECKHAQYLLITPFMPNSGEISRWLEPNSSMDIGMRLEWLPNDRAVALARPLKGVRRGDFHVELQTLHTERDTIEVPDRLVFAKERPLGLTLSEVTSSQVKLAAATAATLSERGTVIVLVGSPEHTWSVAKTLSVAENRSEGRDLDIEHVKRFLTEEMGRDFPLASLLDFGVAVHHAGISDDTRAIVEWLAERAKLRVLVATTTIAQGVNFPVSGLVFGSHQYPYGEEMPPQDFWNIAGRAGRVDQADLGVVSLVAPDAESEAKVREFVKRSVAELNSTLIEMVQTAMETGDLLQLHSFAPKQEWSAFLQYLAHTYRQIGDHDRFASQIEQVLRGTLGFQALRKTHPGWADKLVRGVQNYAERIKGQPLKLVDATGFSWESVRGTLARISDAGITQAVWSPEIFGGRREDLRRIMGVLLRVPELRKNLSEIAGGTEPDGDKLARIVCDWVQGKPLSEMATEHFAAESEDDKPDPDDPRAMTRCCRLVFGRLTQTASWGLAALQSLTIEDSFDSLPDSDQRTLRNLPARVYYGVNTDEAVALRLLGVPRTVAQPLARHLNVSADEPLHRLRARVRGTRVGEWTAALGDAGATYHRVWSIIDGHA